jgi:hypothetical protein
MVDRIIHSRGIVVCEERYLTAMREIQAAEDAGRAGHADGGRCAHILPMTPMHEEKFARVKYCEACKLIIVARSDQIPSEEIPAVAKGSGR